MVVVSGSFFNMRYRGNFTRHFMLLTIPNGMQRDQLMNPDNASWFNVFNIRESTTLKLLALNDRTNDVNPPSVFEIVSAYGTVGLSTGVPYVSTYLLVCNTSLSKRKANYSLSGAFRPLSKLIICVVMLRGRHRGLPVAIDRAVLLPSEYNEYDDSDEDGDDDVDNSGKTSTKIDDGQPINQGIDPYIPIIEKSCEGIMEERRKT